MKFFPAHKYTPGGFFIQSEYRLRDLASSGSDQSGKAQNLPGPEGEIDIGEFAGGRKIFHPQ